MGMNDPLANVLSAIKNKEMIAEEKIVVGPNSKTIVKVLEIMKEKGYIGAFEKITKLRGGMFEINLIGGINDCKVIKPRSSFSKKTFEKYEKRYLPAKGFGIIIVSTVEGFMTLEDAKQKGLGGKLVAYCY